MSLPSFAQDGEFRFGFVWLYLRLYTHRNTKEEGGDCEERENDRVEEVKCFKTKNCCVCVCVCARALHGPISEHNVNGKKGKTERKKGESADAHTR